MTVKTLTIVATVELPSVAPPPPPLPRLGRSQSLGARRNRRWHLPQPHLPCPAGVEWRPPACSAASASPTASTSCTPRWVRQCSLTL